MQNQYLYQVKDQLGSILHTWVQTVTAFVLHGFSLGPQTAGNSGMCPPS